jgi:IMP dehydrogenase
MVEVVIGGTKSARQGYSFDEVAIAPQRRTRDASEVSTNWNIDAYRFETPLIAAPMDSVVSPQSAVTISRNGVLAVLNLEGLWGRYEDPTLYLREIANVSSDQATSLLQRLYSDKPVDHELIKNRITQLKESGITVSVAVSPQRTAELAPIAASSGAEILVIRGTTVSAEHVAASNSWGLRDSSGCPAPDANGRCRRSCWFWWRFLAHDRGSSGCTCTHGNRDR